MEEEDEVFEEVELLLGEEIRVSALDEENGQVFGLRRRGFGGLREGGVEVGGKLEVGRGGERFELEIGTDLQPIEIDPLLLLLSKSF